MTRGATDNDTTAHLEHGEPADLPAITNCASSFRTIPERGLRLWGIRLQPKANTVALAPTPPRMSCVTRSEELAMSDGIPLGTIAGLPVRANWSVLVLLWLFAWSLATTLPQTVPGYHTRDYWVAGVIGAVVLLMSLLAHEATHAVVARRAGMEVSSVTLWMFGGVTRLEGEAQTPRTQFWIAFSGPLTSLLLSAGPTAKSRPTRPVGHLVDPAVCAAPARAVADGRCFSRRGGG